MTYLAGATINILKKPDKNKFDRNLVSEELEKNIILNWNTWGKFQQVWTNQAFNIFKDFDKYLVLIYLMREHFQDLANKFEYYSYDEFYEFQTISINKLNLIKIANELNIPKENIRRKINELQTDEILKREGKKFTLNKKLINYQKPQISLEAISNFIHKKSNIFQGKDWFGDKIEKNEIEIYIKKYFSIIWLHFLKLQIPFLIRNRTCFKDLETWMVWGNVALNHQKKLMDKPLEVIKIDVSSYYKKVSSLKVKYGVNASSIADISNIPRATVIRKLKWLVKHQLIKKNKNLEYLMQYKGKLNKKIEENFKINHITVIEFVTDFFDFYKNSKFKP
ncbi:hypothetical protein OAS47_03285 [Pelagibacteraceae bacterium]|nr:hypothetical protein [Pelagibacteraceae bacterium]